MKIGYLGPIGSYSYEASKKYKKSDDELVEYDKVTKVVEALKKGKTEKCIVPLENAIDKSATDIVEFISKFNDIYIVDELTVDVNHVLMAKTKDTSIARIYSHPQALAQCSKYLSEKYSNVEQVAVSSTSYAARLTSSESDTACICNIGCKEIYGLNVIDENIEDMDKNKSKFIVLSKKKNTRATNKTSIVFSTKDEPGALYRILGLFSMAEINLTKIESRPAKTEHGDYMFFVDVEGDEKDEKIAKTLESIKSFCSEFRILGSY